MLALGDSPRRGGEGGGKEGARTPLLLHLSANPPCFMKVLVEKLLRTTNVKRLYLLIRPKRGVNTAARLEQLLASRLFDRYVLVVGLTQGDMLIIGRWVAELVAHLLALTALCTKYLHM